MTRTHAPQELDRLLADTGVVADLDPRRLAEGEARLAHAAGVAPAFSVVPAAGAAPVLSVVQVAGTARSADPPDRAPRSPGAAGSRRRKVGLGIAGAAVLAGAAAVAAVVLASAPSGSAPPAANSHPASQNTVRENPTSQAARSSGASLADDNRITLAGYQIALPEGFKVGTTDGADTNCTADLHLKPGETERMVTTPAGGCPLVITSVVRSLPADARHSFIAIAGQPGSAATVGAAGQPGSDAIAKIYVSVAQSKLYVPAKLPDGSTVYVTVQNVGFSLARTGDDTVLVQVDGSVSSYFVQQLQQLAAGMEVTPVG
ncbi:MAG: hypothetical protein FWD74_04745 [Actinomycetia bacterium]|nr:hypothetical protein [Actinomycetes bacterium]